MFVRFVVNEKDADSGRRVGLFHVARNLCEVGAISQAEESDILAIRDGFNENLDRTDSFARSRKPHAKRVAISWFRDSATQHIGKMHAPRLILERHGIPVQILKSSKPGYIVYEDDHQVTAEPYADTDT